MEKGKNSRIAEVSWFPASRVLLSIVTQKKKETTRSLLVPRTVWHGRALH